MITKSFVSKLGVDAAGCLKFALGFALILTPSAHTWGQNATDSKKPSKVCLALDPEELLKWLPSAPPNWQLTASQGMSQVSDYPVLQTVAIREFKATPPPPEPGQAPPEPKITRLTLIDTGSDPDSFFPFRSFDPKATSDPGKKSGEKSYYLEECPVVETYTEAKHSLVIDLKDRFILAVDLRNQTDKEREAWIDAIDIKHLASEAAHAPKKPLTPHVFQLVFLNELKPGSRQVSQVTYFTKKEQDAMTRQMERQYGARPTISRPAASSPTPQSTP